MSDSEEDNVRIHVERRAPRPKVRFAAPQVFPVHNSYIPERHAVVNHFRRDESPSSTSSSDYDRPARRRARREPSPSRVKAQRMAWETEMMRNQLVHLQFEQEREADQRHLIMERRDHEEMRRARHELREGKERESLAEMEKRVKKEFEKEILEKTMKEKEAKEKREKEAKEAVERYKLEEAEKALKEMEEKEAFEKMYKSYLEQHLAISGLDEKHVKAIMNKERIEDDKPVVVEERLVVRKHHPYPDSLREFAVDCDRDTVSSRLLYKKLFLSVR